MCESGFHLVCTLRLPGKGEPMLQVLRVAQRSNQNKISFRMGVVWSDAVVVSTGTGEAGDAVRG